MYNFRTYLIKKFTNGVGTSNSSSRDDWIINKLKKITPGTNILDAGAGEARFKKYCKHLEYVSQDIAIYDGVGNNKGYQKLSRDYSNIDIISDIYNIPVENSSFDTILCVEVIEHLTEPIKALLELKRVLKKEGTLILTAPFNSLTHYAPHHYFTGFTEYFYRHHLEELGFELIEINKNGNYFEYIAQEILRIEEVALIYSKKKLGVLFKIIKIMLLMFLNKLSQSDTGSNELNCFGFNVLCKKIN